MKISIIKERYCGYECLKALLFIKNSVFESKLHFYEELAIQDVLTIAMPFIKNNI